MSEPISNAGNTPQDNIRQSRSLEDSRRNCWVCFASDDDDTTAAWVQPCNCRGTTKWVHQRCLQRWVDEKQKGNIANKVACPQCNTEYLIVFPEMGPFLVVLDTVNNTVYKVCPFVAAGVVVGSIYWTAVTYGAVTVMQILGFKDGLMAMEQSDPLVLLLGLPSIPVFLVLGKLVRWEDSVLSFLRKYSPKMPFIRYIAPSFACGSDTSPRRNSDVPPVSDTVSATKVLCSALLFPTIASGCGRLLFYYIPSNLQRTLLGGIAFIAVKGCLKIYYKQQLYVRQSSRKVLDFIPPEVGTGDPQPPQPSRQSPQPNRR